MKIINAILVTIGIVGFTATSAMAYSIDGKVSDWNVDIMTANIGADRKGYLNTTLPSGGLDIDYTSPDDNGGVYDASGNYINGWQYVTPGYSYQDNNGYKNKGNSFDAEAIYFDNDASNAYIAVIAGLPKDGGSAPGNPWYFPGDIGIDTNNDGIYEYGIDVLQSHSGNTGTLYTGNKAKLYYGLTSANWTSPSYSSSSPWEINSGSAYAQLIDFAYGGPWNTHYVMEAMIPLNLLGLDANSNHNLTIHWTMQCGNDVVNLPADVNKNTTPEPATMSLLGLGLAGLLLKRKKA